MLFYTNNFTLAKDSNVTAARTETNSLCTALTVIVSLVHSSASSSIWGFIAKNIISQLSTTSPFFKVAWAPKSFQNPRVLVVRAETHTLFGFKIPITKNELYYSKIIVINYWSCN